MLTGGGYHVYEPIELPVLEEESIFRFFDNPSTEFIRYAASDGPMERMMFVTSRR